MCIQFFFCTVVLTQFFDDKEDVYTEGIPESYKNWVFPGSGKAAKNCFYSECPESATNSLLKFSSLRKEGRKTMF